MDTKETKESIEEFMKDFTENVQVMNSIQYPIQVNKIALLDGIKHRDVEVGTWVSIRPCDTDATYLGVYLGDLNSSSFISYHKSRKELMISAHTNPAIYVPDLKRVVWGMESWWGVIESPDDLRKITDADINDVWYVKALRELTKEEDAKSS